MSSGPPYNKLTLYTAGTPNGLKPALVLEELGLTYDHKTIDIVRIPLTRLYKFMLPDMLERR